MKRRPTYYATGPGLRIVGAYGDTATVYPVNVPDWRMNGAQRALDAALAELPPIPRPGIRFYVGDATADGFVHVDSTDIWVAAEGARDLAETVRHELYHHAERSLLGSLGIIDHSLADRFGRGDRTAVASLQRRRSA